jgi:hypothetical protein
VPRWLRETGFEERAEWESSFLHLSREETRYAGRLSGLLRSSPGLIVRNPEGSSWGVYRELPEGGRCSVSVVMNGVFVNRRTLGGGWTIDFLAEMRDLQGVELHVGELGPLVDESGCGILMLWSERSRLDPPGVERRFVEIDAPFRGSVTGAFWGEGAESVVEVRLEPGGQTGDFDNDGDFVFRSVLPGAYDIVIATADGPVARYPVRVYAYADSWIDAPIERR